MSTRFEFRLQGLASAPGGILFSDLAAICSRLQDLATRTSRWVADSDRLGHSASIVESAGALRLVGLKAGSTVLTIVSGAVDTLSMVDSLYEQEVDKRFWSIVSAFNTLAPPPGAPVAVRQSAVAVLDALAHAAITVEVSRDGGAKIRFNPSKVDRVSWGVPSMQLRPTAISLAGTIERVDLRTSKFRLLDDVGNRFLLEDVQDASSVSRLVGHRVVATGLPVRDSRNRLIALKSPELEPMDIGPWHAPGKHVGPNPSDVEFSDDEWALFRAAARGA